MDCQRFLHRNSTKFSRVVVDSIPHNSTEEIVKKTLEEAVAADTSLLSKKTARSPEGNVDVEPPSSMDDSSMILIEIGVGVDEGPRPNMVIRTRGAILGRTKVTSRAGDEDAEVAVDLQASHRSFCRSHSGTLNESTNVGVKTGGSQVWGPELCV